MGEERTARRVKDAAEIEDLELRRFVEDSLDRIKAEFDPDVLVFFGSRVNGRVDEWSDIDLFVVSDRFQEMAVLPRMRLFRRIASPHIAMDAICYTPQEYERMVKQPTLIREIMETGLRVI